MNRDSFEKNWAQWKDKIQAKWSQLNEMDWKEIHGSWDRFLDKVAHRYNRTKESVEHEMKNWEQAQGAHKQGEHKQGKPHQQGPGQWQDKDKKRKAG